MDPENALALTHRLLHASFWLPTLKSMQFYERSHDDHDGTFLPRVGVVISEDGDAYLQLVDQERVLSGRFRTHQGGGSSLRVRTALVILAEAIRMDRDGVPWPPLEELPAEDGLPRVEGPSTLAPAELLQRLRQLIADEQDKLLPDSTLMSVLCDAARLARDAAQSVDKCD